MIEGVHAALRDRPGLERALRQEYRCCLVDEFQDTDPLQWDIFRRIFLAAPTAERSHPLFLIGDPKQAIYRFRGGDIHTYMDARGALHALSREGKAQGLSLDTNFRSSRGMVEACNAVFAHPRWFHAQAADPGAEAWKLPAVPDPLGYLPARHGGLAVQDCLDATAKPAPVVLRDFADETGKSAVERKVTAWLVEEIAALMADPDRLRIPDKAAGTLRPIGYGDICVLVKKNREKARLEKALFRAGIPFQVDKRAGLYRGDAAGQFLALLESLEDPRDAGKHALALLTRFFRAAGDPPPQAQPAGHPSLVRRLDPAGRDGANGSACSTPCCTAPACSTAKAWRRTAIAASWTSSTSPRTWCSRPWPAAFPCPPWSSGCGTCAPESRRGRKRRTCIGRSPRAARSCS